MNEDDPNVKALLGELDTLEPQRRYKSCLIEPEEELRHFREEMAEAFGEEYQVSRNLSPVSYRN